MPTPRTVRREPGYCDAETNLANSILVMREINRIQFLETFEKVYAPGIAQYLKDKGVKFP